MNRGKQARFAPALPGCSKDDPAPDYLRGSIVVVRRAHNPGVDGSIPSPATN